MAIGKGKYDDLCSMVRTLSCADAAFVIIVNGNNGSGFSCQFTGEARNVIKLAESLEIMAQQLRADTPELLKQCPH